MVVSQDLVKVVTKRFESRFSESVAQIQGQWDKLNGGNIEVASLWAWISELENELGQQANSSTQQPFIVMTHQYHESVCTFQCIEILDNRQCTVTQKSNAHVIFSPCACCSQPNTIRLRDFLGLLCW